MDANDPESHPFTFVKEGNYKEAYPSLVLLSEEGSAYASMVLARIHENGAVGEKDVEKAKYFYERAGSRGEREAYLRLGVMLLDEGMDLEAQTAFETGADLGNLGSMYYLGVILLEKRDARFHDPAIAWLTRAASHGHIFSQRKLISVEMHQAGSFIAKASFIPRILALTFRGFMEAWRDRNSERVL